MNRTCILPEVGHNAISWRQHRVHNLVEASFNSPLLRFAPVIQSAKVCPIPVKQKTLILGEPCQTLDNT